MIFFRILLTECRSGCENYAMIKCHLSRLMGERKLKIADVAKAIGVHRNTITLLYYEKAQRIDFDVLNKLCQYLGCTISDILEFREKD